MGVSFIIASYNCKPYIEECFNSIFNQTYRGDIEIIVCDDCSKDGTGDVLQKSDDAGKTVFVKYQTESSAS